jgi:hypothetical protein
MTVVIVAAKMTVVTIAVLMTVTVAVMTELMAKDHDAGRGMTVPQLPMWM